MLHQACDVRAGASAWAPHELRAVPCRLCVVSRCAVCCAVRCAVLRGRAFAPIETMRIIASIENAMLHIVTMLVTISSTSSAASRAATAGGGIRRARTEQALCSGVAARARHRVRTGSSPEARGAVHEAPKLARIDGRRVHGERQ